MVPAWFRIGSRVRGVTMPLGFAAFFGGLIAGWVLPDDWARDLIGAVTLAGFVFLVVGGILSYLPWVPSMPTRETASPVSGRWEALNSPGTRIPSHGVHTYGQTFAIDLVHEPTEGSRPAFGKRPAFRPPEDFPAFGEDVLAPADGRVVAVGDGARDHRTRSTWGAYAYMLAEGFVRELTGPRRVLGNHVVIDIGGGAFAAIAHLQQGSPTVRVGQEVRRGDVIGRCGNSGNSSEPHVHFQLMDHPRPALAAGLPFAFAGVRIDGSSSGEGVPANEQVLVAEPSAFTRS